MKLIIHDNNSIVIAHLEICPFELSTSMSSHCVDSHHKFPQTTNTAKCPDGDLSGTSTRQATLGCQTADDTLKQTAQSKSIISRRLGCRYRVYRPGGGGSGGGGSSGCTDDWCPPRPGRNRSTSGTAGMPGQPPCCWELLSNCRGSKVSGCQGIESEWVCVVLQIFMC